MTAAANESFEGLLEYLKSSRGFDFTGYKRPMLQRRIVKRMPAVKAETYGDYQAYLEEHEDEFRLLFDTILINVTSFFRDAAPWEFLRDQALPRMLESNSGGELRCWTPGCATGEEAYSLAMVLAEQMGEDSFRARVKIYATDVDEEALTYGRHARYTHKEVEGVPDELRDKYMKPANTHFAVRPEYRRAVIFGRHDLLQDPPISRVDLIVCRNTLIYFTPEAQEHILANFHFALRDGGNLFLGRSEVMLTRAHLFHPIDLKRRVFVKISGATAARDDRLPRRNEERLNVRAGGGTNIIREAGFEAAPVALLVIDRNGQLAQSNLQARILFGLTQRDLGRALQDLELSYRPVELRSRIEEAYAERRPVTAGDVEWPSPAGEERAFEVQVIPLFSSTGEVIGAGISFADVTRFRDLRGSLEEARRQAETAYEELQSTVEELETTNEELESTNEELETTNEELQSTNEELETMNEELQSTNEELEAINDELRLRTDELNSTNVLMQSILTSVDLAVIVVNRELQVEVWNRLAEDLWGLRLDEVKGQHFLNLDTGFPVDQLSKPVRDCLSGKSSSTELTLPATTRRGQQVEVRVHSTPLLGPNERIDGVIIVQEAMEAS